MLCFLNNVLGSGQEFFFPSYISPSSMKQLVLIVFLLFFLSLLSSVEKIRAKAKAVRRSGDHVNERM